MERTSDTEDLWDAALNVDADCPSKSGADVQRKEKKKKRSKKKTRYEDPPSLIPDPRNNEVMLRPLGSIVACDSDPDSLCIIKKTKIIINRYRQHLPPGSSPNLVQPAIPPGLIKLEASSPQPEFSAPSIESSSIASPASIASPSDIQDSASSPVPTIVSPPAHGLPANDITPPPTNIPLSPIAQPVYPMPPPLRIDTTHEPLPEQCDHDKTSKSLTQTLDSTLSSDNDQSILSSDAETTPTAAKPKAKKPRVKSSGGSARELASLISASIHNKDGIIVSPTHWSTPEELYSFGKRRQRSSSTSLVSPPIAQPKLDKDSQSSNKEDSNEGKQSNIESLGSDSSKDLTGKDDLWDDVFGLENEDTKQSNNRDMRNNEKNITEEIQPVLTKLSKSKKEKIKKSLEVKSRKEKDDEMKSVKKKDIENEPSNKKIMENEASKEKLSKINYSKEKDNESKSNKDKRPEPKSSWDKTSEIKSSKSKDECEKPIKESTKDVTQVKQVKETKKMKDQSKENVNLKEISKTSVLKNFVIPKVSTAKKEVSEQKESDSMPALIMEESKFTDPLPNITIPVLENASIPQTNIVQTKETSKEVPPSPVRMNSPMFDDDDSDMESSNLVIDIPDMNSPEPSEAENEKTNSIFGSNSVFGSSCASPVKSVDLSDPDHELPVKELRVVLKKIKSKQLSAEDKISSLKPLSPPGDERKADATSSTTPSPSDIDIELKEDSTSSISKNIINIKQPKVEPKTKLPRRDILESKKELEIKRKTEQVCKKENKKNDDHIVKKSVDEKLSKLAVIQKEVKTGIQPTRSRRAAAQTARKSLKEVNSDDEDEDEENQDKKDEETNELNEARTTEKKISRENCTKSPGKDKTIEKSGVKKDDGIVNKETPSHVEEQVKETKISDSSNDQKRAKSNRPNSRKGKKIVSKAIVPSSEEEDCDANKKSDEIIEESKISRPNKENDNQSDVTKDKLNLKNDVTKDIINLKNDVTKDKLNLKRGRSRHVDKALEPTRRSSRSLSVQSESDVTNKVSEKVDTIVADTEPSKNKSTSIKDKVDSTKSSKVEPIDDLKDTNLSKLDSGKSTKNNSEKHIDNKKECLQPTDSKCSSEMEITPEEMSILKNAICDINEPTSKDANSKLSKNTVDKDDDQHEYASKSKVDKESVKSLIPTLKTTPTNEPRTTYSDDDDNDAFFDPPCGGYESGLDALSPDSRETRTSKETLNAVFGKDPKEHEERRRRRRGEQKWRGKRKAVIIL